MTNEELPTGYRKEKKNTRSYLIVILGIFIIIFLSSLYGLYSINKQSATNYQVIPPSIPPVTSLDVFEMVVYTDKPDDVKYIIMYNTDELNNIPIYRLEVEKRKYQKDRNLTRLEFSYTYEVCRKCLNKNYTNEQLYTNEVYSFQFGKVTSMTRTIPFLPRERRIYGITVVLQDNSVQWTTLG